MEWIKIESIDELPKDGSKFVALYYGLPFIVQYCTTTYHDRDKDSKKVCNYFSLISYDRNEDYEIDEDDEHNFTHYLVLPKLP